MALREFALVEELHQLAVGPVRPDTSTLAVAASAGASSPTSAAAAIMDAGSSTWPLRRSGALARRPDRRTITGAGSPPSAIVATTGTSSTLRDRAAR